MKSCLCLMLALALMAEARFIDDFRQPRGFRSNRQRLNLPTNKRVAKRGNSDEGFLMIGEAPPKMVEARQFGKAVLECSASGNPAPRITWLKDGLPLVKEDRLIEGPLGSANSPSGSMSETKSRINLECISERDAGLYECVAHSHAKQTSVGTEMNVVSFEPNGCSASDSSLLPLAPSIYQWMGTFMQELATDARLICRTLNPGDEIEWFGPQGEKLLNSAKFEVQSSGDLLIRDLKFDDMGVYRCVASNAFGHDQAETFVYPHAPQ